MGQKDPLEKDMATESSILAWEIPWTEGPGGLSIVHAIAESDMTEWLGTHTRWSMFYQESSNKNIFLVRRRWAVSAQQLKGYGSGYYL